MNRDHQFTPGTESDRAAYFCDRCGRSREAHGDSTPPATPVEPPEHGWCDVCPVCGGHPHCPDHGDRRASNPPAVSGEGERLKELEVLEYQIAGGGPLDRDDVRLVRRRNREGVSRWAVVNRGMALTAEGEWEWEPIPSSRTDEYLARTRFQTPEAALDVYKRRASTPTPGASR